MRIDSIQLFRVPLGEAKSASGAELESIFVSMHSGDQFGFGEVSLAKGPTDDQEWSAAVFACLKDWLAPALIGQQISTGQRLQELLAPFKGNPRAKSALDIAWWSLEAMRAQRPLYQLLGAAQNTVCMSGTVGVTSSFEQLLAEIAACWEVGCDHVTLKFRPGWEVEMLRAVRQAFPAAPLAIDCDGLCTLGQMEMFYRLEDFNLKYIEQPLPADDLVGHAMLQSSVRTAICLDQSVTTLARAEQAIDLGSCRMVRIDPARVGGLTPAVAIRDACRAADLGCAVGGGPQIEIASSAALALAVSCDLPIEAEAYSWSKKSWLPSDSTTLAELNEQGKYEIKIPSDVAGCGFLLDVQILVEDAAIEQATIR